MAHQIIRASKWQALKSHLSFSNVITGVLILTFVVSFPIAYRLFQSQLDLRSNANVNNTTPGSATPAATSIPPVPLQIRSQNIQSSSVEILWDESSQATSYTAGYKGVDNVWVIVKGISGQSYTFSGLKPETPYQFGVQSCNALGCSDFTIGPTISTLPDISGKQ